MMYGNWKKLENSNENFNDKTSDTRIGSLGLKKKANNQIQVVSYL